MPCSLVAAGDRCYFLVCFFFFFLNNWAAEVVETGNPWPSRCGVGSAMRSLLASTGRGRD